MAASTPWRGSAKRLGQVPCVGSDVFDHCQPSIFYSSFTGDPRAPADGTLVGVVAEQQFGAPVVAHPDGGWIRLIDGTLEGSSVRVDGATAGLWTGASWILYQQRTSDTDVLSPHLVVWPKGGTPSRVDLKLVGGKASRRKLCEVVDASPGTALVRLATSCDASGPLYLADLTTGRLQAVEHDGAAVHVEQRNARMSDGIIAALTSDALVLVDRRTRRSWTERSPRFPGVFDIGPGGALAVAGKETLRVRWDKAWTEVRLPADAFEVGVSKDHVWALTVDALVRVSKSGVVTRWGVDNTDVSFATFCLSRHLDVHPNGKSVRRRCRLVDRIIDVDLGRAAYRSAPSKPVAALTLPAVPGHPYPHKDQFIPELHVVPLPQYERLPMKPEVLRDPATGQWWWLDEDTKTWRHDRPRRLRVQDAAGVSLPGIGLPGVPGFTTPAGWIDVLPETVLTLEAPVVSHGDTIEVPSLPSEPLAEDPLPLGRFRNADGVELVFLPGENLSPAAGVWVGTRLAGVQLQDGAVMWNGVSFAPVEVESRSKTRFVGTLGGPAVDVQVTVQGAILDDGAPRTMRFDPADVTRLPPGLISTIRYLQGRPLVRGEVAELPLEGGTLTSLRLVDKDVPCGSQRCARIQMEGTGEVLVEEKTLRPHQLKWSYVTYDFVWPSGS